MTDSRFPKTLIVIPALNEAEVIARVVQNVRRSAPWADVLVINDGSSDETGQKAENEGAIVLHMPHRVGIGAGVQTAFMFAERYGYDLVIRNDGDGQHEAADIQWLIQVLQNDEADVVIGSRYIENRGYSSSVARRAGSALLASIISAIIGQRITDPTSGYNGFNRRAILLCAKLYPHDYPEPEAIVVLRRAGLRLKEIPVTMQPRLGGRSSITTLRSFFYMFKVILAIFIDLLRRAPVADM